MAGWHTRLWRRVKVAPGVSINFSKSGPSLSVGPRGAKMTFGRRGVRQTVGIPGTGFYATRRLSSRPSPPANRPLVAAPVVSQPATAAEAAASPVTDDEIVLYFGFATVLGLAFGVLLLVLGFPAGQALIGGVLVAIAGIVYEGLAHHHPAAAKAIVALVVGIISIAAAVIAGIAIVLFGVALFGTGSSGRRRRR